MQLDFSTLPSNKYSKQYKNLILTRQYNKKIKGYTEKHHVFPLAIFGDTFSNVTVNLTYREHFIAHLLLHKMYLKKYSDCQVWVRRMKSALDYFMLYSIYPDGLTARSFSAVKIASYRNNN